MFVSFIFVALPMTHSTALVSGAMPTPISRWSIFVFAPDMRKTGGESHEVKNVATFSRHRQRAERVMKASARKKSGRRGIIRRRSVLIRWTQTNQPGGER
jgi:hypothetical protein